MDKTVICVATPLYPPQSGGPATHVALLENYLPRDQFDLRIVKFSDVSRLPKVLRHCAYFLKVFKNALGARFIYTLDPMSVGVPAYAASWLLAKPLVLRIGGDYAWEQGVQRFGVQETYDEFLTHRQTSFAVRVMQVIESFIARHSHMVIANGIYFKDILEKHWGVQPGRIHVVYSQPELVPSKLSRGDARKKLNIHEDEEIIFSAGRLLPWKGFEGLIEAVSRVRERRSARLVIAGDGPMKSALETRRNEMNAERFVTLLGEVAHDELVLWLKAADVFVLNTKYEGLSHMLLEAFTEGAPVITTPAGGNREIVHDGVTGLLVPYNDIPALSSSIVRLLEDKKFAAELAQHASKSLEMFNPQQATEQLSALFTSI